MSGTELFVLAWFSGNKAIFVLAVFLHWWFYSRVEEYACPLFLPLSSSSPFILILSSPIKRTNNENWTETYRYH